ncbi:hypothetical protein ACAW75_21860 [Fibrella sp. Tmos10]
MAHNGLVTGSWLCGLYQAVQVRYRQKQRPESVTYLNIKKPC